MRSSHVTLIALAVALSSTPTLSAPLFIPVNRLPTSVRTGGILPHPLFFESFKVPTAAVGSLPLNSPVGQHARREMDNLIELVARALEDDESDALNIKPIVKGLGNVVSTGLNLFDIFHHSDPAPPPAPAPPAATPAGTVPQPQRRDLDNFIELVARAAANDQGSDESGAFNFFSTIGHIIGDILRREDIEGLVAREDIDDLLAREESGAISAVTNIVPAMGTQRISPEMLSAARKAAEQLRHDATIGVTFNPPHHARDFDDIMNLLARADVNDIDQSGALNIFNFIKGAASAIGHFFGGGDNNSQPAQQTRELLELFARANFGDDEDESSALNIGGIVNGFKTALKDGSKIGKILGIASDATSVISNVKSALTPPPPPAAPAPATARSLNELD